jgi:hypothetical protein
MAHFKILGILVKKARYFECQENTPVREKEFKQVSVRNRQAAGNAVGDSIQHIE